MTDWHLLSVVVFVFHFGGVLHAAHALMNVRTSQGTIAWIASLILLPYLAIPLYWILGRSRFLGYLHARRTHDWAHTEKLMALVGDTRLRDDGSENHRLRTVAEKLSGLPMSAGNETNLLINGEETYECMFDAIRRAEDYILVLFFIVKGDQIGGRFKEALLERASSEVRVHFLYDEVGSWALSKGYLQELENGGVKVCGFRSTRGRGNRFQINFRNHRKMVVVDGKEALVGGLNIGDEYAGVDPRFGPWRDTHLSLRGPAVKSVQVVFVEDWHWATGDLLQLNWEDDFVAAETGKNVLIIPTGPENSLNSCHLFYIEAANCARKRLWIASPYFVPDGAVVAALQTASLRGVDVRILLPERSDHLLVHLSSFSYLKEMEDARVKMFRYEGGFLHQKIMLMDDEVAVVGTANLDNRSFRLNFEILAMVDDRDFANEILEMLEDDFFKSKRISPDELSLRPIWFRIGVAVARLFAPIQ